ncbi:MAG: hypothetical protein J1F11_06280 [Oscillospiraceae bacterium]|nr:hypothetical protein [Oscillospiraceae bacterium]
MADQILRDQRGNPIGKITEYQGKLRISDHLGHFLGSYDPKTNTTYDYLNRKVGTGNLLTTLL